MTFLDSLLKENKLPTVNVEAQVSKKSLVDIAVAGIIMAVVIMMINKLVFSKL